MRFAPHYELEGRHAFLSASKYHWIRYDDDRIERVFKTSIAAQRGTRLHAFANEAIKLRQKMPRTTRTMHQYVNDAIGFRMETEQPLYYSANSFGTADAISFRNNMLRIHDLKTGVAKASMDQLLIYTALFCHEYGIKPTDIEIELRIYQNDEIFVMDPDRADITIIMDKIVAFDKRIEALREEAYL